MKKTIIAEGLLFLSLSVLGQTKRVVVETALAPGVEEEIKGIFLDGITWGLSATGEYETIANREEYKLKIQGEIKAQEEGLIDDSQWIEIGRAQSAQLVMFATIRPLDGQYFVSVRLLDIESGVAKKSIRPRKSTRAQLMDTAIEIADEIAHGGISTKKKEDIEHKGVPCDALPGSIDGQDNGPLEYKQALLHCEQQGDGWRLPTIKELQIVFKANTTYGTMLSRTTYWTSDERNSSSVYTVEFPWCNITYESKTSSTVFRCVRTE